MKNLKIAMIFVAAVAFFCSCGDPEAPKVTLQDANGATEVTLDLNEATELAVNLTCTIESVKAISTVELTRTMFDANEEVKETVAYELADNPEGLTEYAFPINETLAEADLADVAKVVYEVVITDKKDLQAKETYNVNVIAKSIPEGPQYTEAEFTWMRVGNTREGLDQFGLQWPSNAKVTQAVIKPVESAKLYIVDATAFAAEQLPTLSNPVEQYKSVSCEANGTYNDFIATEYNGKTFIINVTKGTVSSEAAGTKVIITGKYHEFATSAPEAK